MVGDGTYVPTAATGTFSVDIVSLAEKAKDALGETVGRWEGGHKITIEASSQSG